MCFGDFDQLEKDIPWIRFGLDIIPYIRCISIILLEYLRDDDFSELDSIGGAFICMCGCTFILQKLIFYPLSTSTTQCSGGSHTVNKPDIPPSYEESFFHTRCNE